MATAAGDNDAITSLLPTEVSGSLRLDTVDSLQSAFRRIPDGPAILRLASRLGLITDPNEVPASKFPTQYSSLTDPQLSDASARVIARAAALSEMTGMLGAVQMRMKARSKSIRAAARMRARAQWALDHPESRKAPTVSELADMVEADQQVIDLDNQAALVDMLAGMLSGAKDAHLLLKEGLSREVTLRSAQLNAKVRF